MTSKLHNVFNRYFNKNSDNSNDVVFWSVMVIIAMITCRIIVKFRVYDNVLQCTKLYLVVLFGHVWINIY